MLTAPALHPRSPADTRAGPPKRGPLEPSLSPHGPAVAHHSWVEELEINTSPVIPVMVLFLGRCLQPLRPLILKDPSQPGS